MNLEPATAEQISARSPELLQDVSPVHDVQSPTVMVSAGEPSSDLHAGAVIRAFRELCPNAKVFGMGGRRLREAGTEIIVDCEHHGSVMGLTEVVGSLKNLYAAYRSLLREADVRRPSVVMLVDFPDFNFLLGKALKRRGVRVLYFISPQVWAWRRGRAHTMKRFVDVIASIFPFEREFFARRGIAVEYVGHPFVDLQPVTDDRAVLLRKWGLDPSRPVVALLPGSRRAELSRLLPPMIEALALLREGRPGVQAVIAVAPGVSHDTIASLAGGIPPDVVLVDQAAREVLAASDAAVVTSGTATVEAALARVPFLVVYKMSSFTYRVARLLVRHVDYIAMANLIAGKKVVEELIQSDVTPGRIREEVERLLGDAKASARMRADLAQVRTRLESTSIDEPSGSERTTAHRVARMLAKLAAASVGGA